INKGYVAFGGNPKGDKITSKGKFEGKADEGFLVGYSVNSKAFRVFNIRTMIVQETLHINFLENKPNVAGISPKWMFDIDTLTQSMNYQPIVVGNQPHDNAGIKENLDADDAAFDVKENEKDVNVFLVVVTSQRNMMTRIKEMIEERVLAPFTAVKPNPTNSTNIFNTSSPSDTAVNSNFRIAGKSLFIDPSNYPDDPDMPALKDIVYSDDEKDVGAEADFLNLETNISVSHIPTTRVYKDYHVTQIIGDLTSAPQTRSMARMVKEQGGLN
nr:ribonuclease H-like domain-containing protein [Tanacetum cinerariifolium]